MLFNLPTHFFEEPFLLYYWDSFRLIRGCSKRVWPQSGVKVPHEFYPALTEKGVGGFKNLGINKFFKKWQNYLIIAKGIESLKIIFIYFHANQKITSPFNPPSKGELL